MNNRATFKIGFIGCGKLGEPTARLLAEHYDVAGYDIQPKKIPGVKMCNTPVDAVRHRDFVFVAVQTPHSPEYDGTKPVSTLPPRDFDYSILEQCITEIAQHITAGTTLVIISTVLPGTIRYKINPLLPESVSLIYNPYLIAMGTVKEDLINPEMLIIGTRSANPQDTEKLEALYAPILKSGTRIERGTWEEAEAIKIFYNTFISMKISFVNMIQDVAQKVGNMNPDTVSTAIASSTLRIMSKAYMQPGMGDGGPCHPRDNIALRHLSKQLDLGYDLFGAIAHSRDMQAKNLAQFLLSYSKDVVILGRAYKQGINMDDGSYALLVGNQIEAEGGTVQYYDPEMNITETRLNNHQVFLINHHTAWLNNFSFPPDSVVVDPWRKWKSPSSEIKVVFYGIKEVNSVV